MNYLLYCIFQQELDDVLPVPGMNAVAAHGLAAAVSPVEETCAAPSVSSLLTYERVVEAIHARKTVIPLRYGCFVESEDEIVRLLENHRQEYELLLDRLRGMTEMGIRVLWPARPHLVRESSSSPGAAYLASLRNRYVPESDLTPEEARLAGQITALLASYYTEQRREVSSSNLGRMVSQYFLTAKNCVERFRNGARQICAPSGTKLLLSGPWPPYTFAVSPD